MSRPRNAPVRKPRLVVRRPDPKIRYLDTAVEHRPIGSPSVSVHTPMQIPPSAPLIEDDEADEAPPPPPKTKSKSKSKPKPGPAPTVDEDPSFLDSDELREQLAALNRKHNRLRQAVANLCVLVRTRVDDPEVVTSAIAVGKILNTEES